MSDTTPNGNDAAAAHPTDSTQADSQALAQPAAAATPTWPVTYPMAYQAAVAQAAAPPIVPPGAAPQATEALAPYPPTPGYPAAAQGPQTSSSAIVALVLAIASWVVCPLVLAIIALVFASKADREIASSGGQIQGGGLSTAAKIVSWINIGIFVAAMVVAVFIVVIVVIAGGLSQVVPAGQV
jgi:hypothetical protein